MRRRKGFTKLWYEKSGTKPGNFFRIKILAACFIKKYYLCALKKSCRNMISGQQHLARISVTTVMACDN
jgi:hypothetical protein